MYQNKFLKYKNKYLELKNQINLSQIGGSAGGGALQCPYCREINLGNTRNCYLCGASIDGTPYVDGTAPVVLTDTEVRTLKDNQGTYVQVLSQGGIKSFVDSRRNPLNPVDFENGAYRLVKSNVFNKYKETHLGLASTIAGFENMNEKLGHKTPDYNPLEDPYIKDMLLVTSNNDPVAKAALLRLLRNILK